MLVLSLSTVTFVDVAAIASFYINVDVGRVRLRSSGN